MNNKPASRRRQCKPIGCTGVNQKRTQSCKSPSGDTGLPAGLVLTLARFVPKLLFSKAAHEFLEGAGQRRRREHHSG